MRKEVTEWYLNINMKEKFPRGDKATLDHIRQLITNCIDATKSNGNTEKWFSELRTKIHEMDLYKFVTPILVKKSKVLEPEGLLQIFDGPDKDVFPWDIAADAEALWLRWMGGDLDGFLMRGIVATKTVNEEGVKKTAYSIDKQWKKRSANVPGPNGLINGQWWPLRICALRDGAHGASEGGISGQTDKGAYSIVVSKGEYADDDNGETLEYCGTKSSNPSSNSSTEPVAPTADTLLLEKAYMLKQPVRVLRAAKKGSTSKYAPREGVRYDGMYEIVGKKLLDPATAMIRFSLRRLPGQDAIRCQGVEARPSNLELVERRTLLLGERGNGAEICEIR
ncbi:hypothetical protein OIDMADRAFT_168505 [Oidiodendron maius Zn]|uniref:YDG domain-containing protein n=1 Tax=Oidiodendron maius (strain Zn) TaxID=913774 RepID=A0A0C3GPV4_OIDMZ|nr:hypothetical protein OIDMADRAFT_168505 [Oidiodendron maius Zn]